MQKVRMMCLTAAAAVLALPLGAADQPLVTRVTSWKVKAGMEAKFEAGLKKHNEFHRKQGDALGLSTAQVQSGPNTGSYVRFASNWHWQDFDVEAKMADADQADTAVNTDPYIESATTRYYRLLSDLSRPKEDGPAAMFAIVFYRVKFDKVDDFTMALRKFHEAIGKTQWPAHYAWFALANGGDGPEFVLSIPHDSFADFNPLEKPFDKMMEEAYGRAEAESISEMFSHSVAGVSSEIIAYRADLSYVPAKK
jgi:hypothetical protein